jgi:hypothetical protein
MARFDRDRRATFTRWGTYAIKHGGKQYPPKEILRMTVGDIGHLSGGEATNHWFRDLGFIVGKADDDIAAPQAPHVSAVELADWRRALIRILNTVEQVHQARVDEGVAARINRLSRSGRIPRGVAALMRTVTEARNEAEYEDKNLTPAESQAVTSAWRAITEWADMNGYRR